MGLKKTCRRIPGKSQEDMRSMWTAFVRGFPRFSKKVFFNGDQRNVFVLSRDQLCVLDEYHGDLEILDVNAKHLGSTELLVQYEEEEVVNPLTKRREKIWKNVCIIAGTFKAGAKHKYTWR